MKMILSLLLLVFVALPVAVNGQELSDPTRPPMEFANDYSSKILRNDVSKKGLRSVIISASRCSAIIDGKNINLGEQYGGQTVVEINANSVVLEGRNSHRTISLYPGVKLNVTTSDSSEKNLLDCTLKNLKKTHRVDMKEIK